MDTKKKLAKASKILGEINEQDVPEALLERFKDVQMNLAILWLQLDGAFTKKSGPAGGGP